MAIITMMMTEKLICMLIQSEKYTVLSYGWLKTTTKRIR